MVRPLAYITSDWSDDEFEARSMARKFCRNVYEAGFSVMRSPRNTRTDWKWQRSFCAGPAF